MGLELAREAAARGASVELVAANVAERAGDGVLQHDVSSAAELEACCRELFPACDLLLMAAAVADYRPIDPASGKLDKSQADALTLRLERTTDVLAALAAERRPGQTLVGFAAESGEQAFSRAAEKLERKGLDMVVANDISNPAIGFDSTENEVVLVTRCGRERIARAPKRKIAAAILDCAESLRAARQSGSAPAPQTH